MASVPSSARVRIQKPEQGKHPSIPFETPHHKSTKNPIANVSNYVILVEFGLNPNIRITAFA
jgi:hypothetical protein